MRKDIKYGIVVHAYIIDITYADSTHVIFIILVHHIRPPKYVSTKFRNLCLSMVGDMGLLIVEVESNPNIISGMFTDSFNKISQHLLYRPVL